MHAYGRTTTLGALLILLSTTIASPLGVPALPEKTSDAPLPRGDTSATAIIHTNKLSIPAVGGGVASYKGRGTWFTPGLGACGTTVGNHDSIVALNIVQYGNLGKVSGNCFKMIRIKNMENGRSTDAMIQDACPNCAWGGLDLSPATFQAIAAGGLGEGVLKLSWYFIDQVPAPSSTASKWPSHPTSSRIERPTQSRTGTTVSTTPSSSASASPTGGGEGGDEVAIQGGVTEVASGPGNLGALDNLIARMGLLASVGKSTRQQH